MGKYKRFFKILFYLVFIVNIAYPINNCYIYSQNKYLETKNEFYKNNINNENIKSNNDKKNSENSKLDENKKSEDDIKSQYEKCLKNLFDYRNDAIINYNGNILKQIYDTDIKFGLWAYEHEIKKMQYLKNWSDKQGVVFDDINADIKINKIKQREKDIYGIICTVKTTYKYYYENQPDVKNEFKIGTQHYLNIKSSDKRDVITKEWYTDPFADSLNLDNINSKQIKSYILTQEGISLKLNSKQQKAVEYAHKYCGAATDVNNKIYLINPNYKDFNSEGGDCANFASQIMYESGTFLKNQTWNYENGSATKAWVNAQGFKNYLVYSQRGYYLSKGSYEEVYKDAYKLRPGDIVGYEKNGRITHVSTVTGLDSKGYPSVTCHNTDRLLVPWDLGWSDKNIRFHLIKINY